MTPAKHGARGSISASSRFLRPRSDEQLVSLVRQGNHDAFRAIYDRYQPRVFAYIRHMLGSASSQDAEDVLQDTFTRVYTALRVDQRRISLRAWVFRIAHNRCIDHLRRPGPPTMELFEAAGQPLHEPFVEVQRREELQRLLTDIAHLPERQRSALLLREINGLSYRDVAAVLKVTVPAVRSLLVRARVALTDERASTTLMVESSSRAPLTRSKRSTLYSPLKSPATL